LNGSTGQPFGDLVILKERESSEKDILAKFIPIFIGEKPFDFIPIGDDSSSIQEANARLVYQCVSRAKRDADALI